MSKVTLKNVGSGYNTQANINANNDLIEAAFDNTLSRDGTSPNEMLGDLDMNGHAIQNLPDAVNPRDPVTLAQAGAIVGLTTPLTSDLIAQFLDPDDLVDKLEHCAEDGHGDTGYFRRTQQEAGLTIADYRKAPGVVERYGVNTIPGTTDMTVALASARAQALLLGGSPVVGNSNYKVSSTVNLRNAEVNLEYATITIGHSGIGLIIGGSSSTTINPIQRIGTMVRTVTAATTTTPDIRVSGTKCQAVYLGNIGYVQLWADTATTADMPGHSGSIAYSVFYLTGANPGILHLAGNESSDGDATQWINENRFFLNRVSKLLVTGTYAHNHNHFYHGNFEGASEIRFEVGRSNYVFDARFEGTETGGVIYFGPTTMANVVTQSWGSSGNDLSTETIRVETITDEGQGNIICQEKSSLRTTSIVGKATIDDPVFDTQLLYPGRAAHIGCVRTEGSPSSTLLETDFIRVRKNDVIGFSSEWNETQFTEASIKYRLAVFVYDEYKRPITPVFEEDWISNGDGIAVAGAGYISAGTGGSDRQIMLCTQGQDDTQIWPDNIAFVRLRLTGSSSQADLQGASTIHLYIRRSNLPKSPHKDAIPDMGRYNKSGGHLVSAIPTQGYAPLGYVCQKSDGTAHYLCTRSVDTYLTAGAILGATSITVDNVTGVATGDIIGILNNDNLITDWRAANVVSGNTVTLTGGGLTGACDIGNRVVFVDWTTCTY